MRMDIAVSLVINDNKVWLTYSVKDSSMGEFIIRSFFIQTLDYRFTV